MTTNATDALSEFIWAHPSLCVVLVMWCVGKDGIPANQKIASTRSYKLKLFLSITFN